MSDFNRHDDFNGYQQEDALKRGSFAAHMTRVFGWMFFGLAMTAAVSYYTAVSSLRYLVSGPFVLLILFGAELLLVWNLSKKAMHMRYENAAAAFVVYSGLNGLTLSMIFLRYNLGSIALAFMITSVFFGFFSLYGYITKQDLTSWGSLLMFGLVGIILATLVNFFLRSDSFMYILSYITVAVFLGLTAYDTQKIKHIYSAYAGTDKEKNIAILGALSLYLDFINLFLSILRILNRRS